MDKKAAKKIAILILALMLKLSVCYAETVNIYAIDAAPGWPYGQEIFKHDQEYYVTSSDWEAMRTNQAPTGLITLLVLSQDTGAVGTGKPDAFNNWGANYCAIRETFLYFPTASLPIGSTVTAAQAHIYMGGSARMAILKGTQGYPLSISDFNAFSSLYSVVTPSSVSQYYVINVPNDDVSHADYTKIAIVNNDYVYQDPYWSGIDFDDNAYVALAAIADINQRPYLTVTYDIGTSSTTTLSSAGMAGGINSLTTGGSSGAGIGPASMTAAANPPASTGSGSSAVAGATGVAGAAAMNRSGTGTTSLAGASLIASVGGMIISGAGNTTLSSATMLSGISPLAISGPTSASVAVGGATLSMVAGNMEATKTSAPGISFTDINGTAVTLTDINGTPL